MKNVCLLNADIDIKTLRSELDMKNGWEKWSTNMKGHGPAFKHSSRQALFGQIANPIADIYSNYKELPKFLLWFVETYGGEIKKASYYLIPVGRKIVKHRDGSTFSKDKDRFHLVISGSYAYTVSEDRGETQEDEKNVFKEGELWWFDNKKYHEAENNDTVDRISLVFDVYKSNWRDMI